MSNFKRKIILGISDPHCGFELGLTNPETELRNKQAAPLTESQNYIWNDVYLPGIEKTKELAGKDDIHVMFLGDITHGNKFNSEQLSTRMSDQISYAYWALLPLLQIKNVKSLDMAIGTGVHVFEQGSAEILVADRLQEKFSNKPINVTYHGLASFGNFTIDYAHHGPGTGSRNWLHGNVAKLYLKSMMMDDLDAGDAPANIVLRGHYHVFTKEWCSISRMGQTYESWIVVMPPLCLPSDYTHKATKSAYRITTGVIAFEIIERNGIGRLYETHPMLQTIDFRSKRTL